MKFTTDENIQAPIDFVFDQVTDFDSFERLIVRRGGAVERITDRFSAGVGPKWHVTFSLRGAQRQVIAEVTAIERPNAMTLEITSASADATLNVDLLDLGPTDTRLTVAVQANAKGIAAKLLFQSMQFAKQKNESRFKDVVSNFARDVEKRHRG